MTLEKEIEGEHRRVALSLGWFVEKIKAAGRKGFPDRFYARGGSDVCRHCGRGRVVLIEWKKPGGRLSGNQRIRIAQLQAEGVEVHVVDNVEDANKILG